MRTSSIANDANSEAGSHSAEANGETCAQLKERGGHGHFLLDGVGHDDADHEAVDG